MGRLSEEILRDLISAVEEVARRPRRRRRKGRRKGEFAIMMPPEIVPSEEFSGEVREERENEYRTA